MSEPKLQSQLRRLRETAALSQAALAERVGVSRQAVIAIEAGRQVPSTTLALQLAQVLGCSIEDLFQLTEEHGLSATISDVGASPQRSSTAGDRVAVGRVDGVWVAHRVGGATHLAADGVVKRALPGGTRAALELLTDPKQLEHNLLVAGCAPLLGVLAGRLAVRFHDARITWFSANSQRAVDLFARGHVHVAGLHSSTDASPESNLRALRKQLKSDDVLVVNLTRWQQGFVVARGNPLAIREPQDLLRAKLRFAQREDGSSARQLTQSLLRSAKAPKGTRLTGPEAMSHAEVAHLVRAGAADVGVGILAEALGADLDFVPLSEERFDLVLSRACSESAPGVRLLDMLSGGAFRKEAQRMPGYDSSATGEVVALSA